MGYSVATMDARVVGFPLGRDHRGNVVVVRGSWLGRILGVGSSRERFISPVADRYSISPFGDGAGTAQHAAALDAESLRRDVRSDDPWYVPHALRNSLFGARVHDRTDRILFPRVHLACPHRDAGACRGKFRSNSHERKTGRRRIARDGISAEQSLSDSGDADRAGGNALS